MMIGPGLISARCSVTAVTVTVTGGLVTRRAAGNPAYQARRPPPGPRQAPGPAGPGRELPGPHWHRGPQRLDPTGISKNCRQCADNRGSRYYVTRQVIRLSPSVISDHARDTTPAAPSQTEQAGVVSLALAGSLALATHPSVRTRACVRASRCVYVCVCVRACGCARA